MSQSHNLSAVSRPNKNQGLLPSPSLRHDKRWRKMLKMNPLTQQHIIRITLSGRGGEEREAGETVGSIYGEQAERQYCKSGGKKLVGEGGWWSYRER